MTPNQQRIYDFIQSYETEHSIPPSNLEISEALEMNYKSVSNHLQLMLKREYIKKIRHGLFTTKF